MEFELSYSAEQEAFRKEVREWLAANMPAGISTSPRVEEHPRPEMALICTAHNVLKLAKASLPA